MTLLDLTPQRPQRISLKITLEADDMGTRDTATAELTSVEISPLDIARLGHLTGTLCEHLARAIDRDRGDDDGPDHFDDPEPDPQPAPTRKAPIGIN